ncbi:MAG: hypothetical protein IH985_06695 [Planctomycetes bacterium]|nr:hypothetical protein [Planctomycetota bacterium]
MSVGHHYVRPLRTGRLELGTRLQRRWLPITYTVDRGVQSVIYEGLGDASDWNESIVALYGNVVREQGGLDSSFVHPDRDGPLADIDRVYTRLGRCQIAVSEGIADSDGVSIGAKLIAGGERDAHGNVQLSGSGALGDQLSSLIRTALTPTGGTRLRVRADTFGYLQRCWPDASQVDVIEAREVGRFAAGLAGEGHADGSVAIVRTGSGVGDEPYASAYKRIELEAVVGKTRRMPDAYINGSSDVSSAFIDYCSPLVGELPRFASL